MMLRRYAALAAVLVALGPMAGAVDVAAQRTPAQQAQEQQMQQMQQLQAQMQRMENAAQRMAQIQERAQEMEQTMLREMRMLQEQERLQLQDQDRLRQQEHLRTMAHAVAEAAGQMTQTMTQAREMLHATQTVPNREMEREMGRLGEHVQTAGVAMEQALQVMEQLRQRLNQP